MVKGHLNSLWSTWVHSVDLRLVVHHKYKIQEVSFQINNRPVKREQKHKQDYQRPFTIYYDCFLKSVYTYI